MTTEADPAQPAPQLKASIVPGTGTDEEIAARCAEKVGGWNDMRPEEQAETVRLMRSFGDLRQAPSYRGDRGSGAERISAVGNPTLHSLQMAELMATGSEDYEYDRLASLSAGGADSLSARLAFVQGAKPQDTVQSSLAVQMACTHDAGLKALRMAGDALTVEQAQVYGNLATRLLNVYARQAETLAKLQRGGSQLVKVVHVDQRSGVHVAAGAQAVVAETFNSGGVSSNVDHQAYGTDTIGLSPEVLGYDPQGNGVPITSGERQGAVPDTRRRKRVGRAQG